MHSKLPRLNSGADHPIHDEIIRRYQAGESSDMIAPDYNVTGGTIRHRLRHFGVTRSRSEAKRLHMQRIGPEGRQQITAAAHDAVRGMVRTDADLAARALGKESTGTLNSDEQRLWRILEPFGELVGQKAVGPYNVDIAVNGAVAVELFGGRWHLNGRHAARFDERVRYLFDQGWALVIVWNTHPRTLTTDVADQIGPFVDEMSRHPSPGGQYRVMWGDGKLCARGSHDVDELTLERARPRR